MPGNRGPDTGCWLLILIAVGMWCVIGSIVYGLVELVELLA